MDPKLFDAAVERAKKTWARYIAAICILHLTFLIDALSGFSFLSGEKAIELANFKVVREALSATYGILFLVFVITAFLESQLLKKICGGAGWSAPQGLTQLDLWFLSPFSRATPLRWVFWFLLIDGFFFLGQFSIVHFTVLDHRIYTTKMCYIGIGIVDTIIFFVCVPFAVRTYRNYQFVRARLHPDDHVA